jgi:glycosyltransferase involved in cell wall biosynthesis
VLTQACPCTRNYGLATAFFSGISLLKPAKETNQVKVALVHDWLVSYRGGEKVLAALAELYPEAPIYTLFYKPESMPRHLRERMVIFPPLLNRFMLIRKLLLPLLPHLVESFPLFSYDLVISTSSCVAKGVIPGPQAKHLSYIHSPMRYIWDQRLEYFQQLAKFPGALALINYFSKNLRLWDVVSTGRCDRLLVNSHFVGSRVRKYYGRSSSVVHPPIELEAFYPPAAAPRADSYWLAAGALVPYKRVDLAIAACEALGQPLVIAGSGSEEKKLRKLAGKYTKFHIAPGTDELRELLQGARALLFPGVEDFGMLAIEAMACGTPVVALAAGGALDFIKPGRTGEFFPEATSEALQEVMQGFSRERYSCEELVAFSQQFSKQIFQRNIKEEIAQLVAGSHAQAGASDE